MSNVMMFLVAFWGLMFPNMPPAEAFATRRSGPPSFTHFSCPRTSTHLCSSSTADGPTDSTLRTIRLPLTRIFNGEREYLFSTRSNVRSFEWTLAEQEDLFESIFSLTDPDDELELNVLMVLPRPVTDEFRMNFGRISQMYDVHDGQQRIVSLSLFLGAMRDNFLLWGDEFEDDAREVSRAIYPIKSRLDPVVRIKLRDRNGRWLDYLLSRKGENGEMYPKDEPIPLPKPRSRKHLTESDVLVLEAYEYFYRRINELSPNEALDLLENFMAKTYVLLCIPSSAQIARNWVMGLGKGKNLEPVDEFKSLVCFRCVKGNDQQDKLLEEWDQLSEEIGRKPLETACTIIGQMWLQKRVFRNGEISLMEDFLKDYMEMNPNSDGSVLFRHTIVPTAKALFNFQNGQIDLLGQAAGNKKNGDSSALNELPSLTFLRTATQIPTSKELLMVILHLLISWYATKDHVIKSRIQQDMYKLEAIALWIMLAKPKPAVRLQRCFSIIEQCQGKYGPKMVTSKVSKTVPWNVNNTALELTQEEMLICTEKLDNLPFGAGVASAKVAKAILERLNEHELASSTQCSESSIEYASQLEHVLPQKFMKNPVWTAVWRPEDPDADTWMHRIGNLALLDQKLHTKISNGSFESKKASLEQSPYPLTREVSKHMLWDTQAVLERHHAILNLAKQVWRLDIVEQEPATV